MKALTITPGVASSARLVELPRPQPGPGEVLVRTLEVGICGTDRELNAGSYGEAPPGASHLVIGHECLGEVAAVGEGAVGFAPGDLVVPTVRRPDGCPNCQAGEWDMCLWGGYTERGIKGRHGFTAEYFAEEPPYLVKLPPELRAFGVLLEPLSIVEKAISQALRIQERLLWRPSQALVLGVGPIGLLATALLRLRGLKTWALATSPRQSLKARLAQEVGADYLEARQAPLEQLGKSAIGGGNLDLIIEATGASSVAFGAMAALGTNGVLALTGVSAGHLRLEVPADALNLSLVLGNKVVFGSVNANRSHFFAGVRHLAEIENRWPGWLARLITRRLPMEAFAQALKPSPDDIKTVLVPGL